MLDELRVVIVEDNEDDCALLLDQLRRISKDVQFQRVLDAGSFRDALRDDRWDAVLCDWTLPSFGAPEALDILKSAGHDVPFIVITGSISEEVAVDAMRAGARDVVSKDRMSRLLPALQREVHGRKLREARQLAERELLASEARYEALFQSSPLPMWAFDRETLAFVQVNEAAVRHYGYSREEFASMTLKDIRPAEDLPALLSDVAKHSAMDIGSTWRHRKKDGSIILVEIKANDFVLDGRSLRLVLATDITERRRAEEALRRAEEQLREGQKMEAVGRLAGGVAHDFNNLLSIILGYTELAAMDLRPGDPLHAELSEVTRAARHAGDLVRHLLAFSRNQVLRPQVLSLHETVARMSKMIASLLGNKVELIIDTDPNLAAVEVDPVQIEQVLLNLAVNARDAMPDGGRLVVETRCVPVRDTALAGTGGPPVYVLLSVSDTGAGMSEETMSRIFEPFFTTKEPGKGTGLGLSTVYGIVNQSGGHIKVTSKLGDGTKFDIYLPPCAGTHAPVSTRLTSIAEMRGGAETILLVEDDASVRVMLRRMLKGSGYEVIEAKGSGDALIMFEKHPGPVHLLLASLSMPVMGGAELASRLVARNPELRVVYLGNHGSYADDGAAVDARVPLVPKPVRRDTLLAKVREALDGTGEVEYPTRR